MQYWVHLSRVKVLAFEKATQVFMNGRRNTKTVSATKVIEMAREFEEYLLEEATCCVTDE